MRSRRAGLTLLELLIALALMSLIAALLLSSLSTSARVWERAQGLNAADSKLVLRQQLRAWIANMKPHRYPYGRAQSVTGNGERLSFITAATLPGLPPRTEPRITIEIIRSARGDRIAVRIEALNRGGNIVHSEERMLAEGLSRAALSYIVDAGSDAAPTDELPDGRSLPLMVKIVSSDALTVWPPFYVAIDARAP